MFIVIPILHYSLSNGIFQIVMVFVNRDLIPKYTRQCMRSYFFLQRCAFSDDVGCESFIFGYLTAVEQ